VRFPEFGSIVAKYLGRDDASLPNFIKISSQGNAGSGFLGPRYMPFPLNESGQLPPFSKGSASAAVDQRRNELRQFVEGRFAETRRAEPVRMFRESYEGARRLQSALSAFDITEE